MPTSNFPEAYKKAFNETFNDFFNTCGRGYAHSNEQHKRDAAAKLQFDVTAAPSKQAEELAPVPDLSKMSAADLLALLQKIIPPTFRPTLLTGLEKGIEAGSTF